MSTKEKIHDEAIEAEKKASYFERLSHRLAAQLVQADASSVGLRHELEQRRRGFSLLAHLTGAIEAVTEKEAFVTAAHELNATLNMQRTAVLMMGEGGDFRATILQGYSRELMGDMSQKQLVLPKEMLNPQEPVLVTRETPEDFLQEVREALSLRYFISTPVMVKGQVEAVLVTGRMSENSLFMRRLDSGDVEAVQAISAFLSALLTRGRLTEVEHLANHDALTGLPNIRLGKDRLSQALAAAKRERSGVGLLFIDLDGFKAVNDTLGHEAGDDVLKEVASRLVDSVREVDTVARLGGDEFIVILPGTHDREGMARVAQGIIATISEPMDCIDDKLPVGASVGIALYPDHAESAADLLKAADGAMYDKKKAGKNGYVFAEPL